jgi:signal transduction histidine kinase
MSHPGSSEAGPPAAGAASAFGSRDGRGSERDVVLGVPPSTRVLVSLRVALIVGFGLTVSVWVVAGIYFSGRVADLDRRTTEVSERYVRAQQLLTAARVDVLLGSVHVRDVLLDPDSRESEETNRQVITRLEEAADGLARYVPILNSPIEQVRVQRLLGEITELRQAILEMMATDRREWPNVAASFLRGRLTPRRQAFMNVAEELGTLNRVAFVEHQAAQVNLYRETQARIWQVMGATLLVSLGIAMASMLYAGRLQQKVRLQHGRDIDQQRGLQRLSAELIRVREEERRGLARELHDGIGQLLAAAKFELVTAQRTIDEQGGPDRALDSVRPIVEQSIQAVRDLSHTLHPAVLDDLGLPAAVDLYVKEFRRRHAIKVDLCLSGPAQRLPRDTETAAYRIVQEALTNVSRHARASSCRVSLTWLAQSLVVVVGDDGRGFAREQPAGEERGLGLVSMRERAAQLGGSFVIESGAGHGTRVVVDLPVGGDAPRPVVVQRGTTWESSGPG